MKSPLSLEKQTIVNQAKQLRLDPARAAELGWQPVDDPKEGKPAGWKQGSWHLTPGGALLHAHAQCSPLAILQPGAVLDEKARVGAYCVVAGYVNAQIEKAHVTATGVVNTTGLVSEAHIAGAVLGNASCIGPVNNARRRTQPPQEWWPADAPRLVIGPGCQVDGQARLEGVGELTQGARVAGKVLLLGSAGDAFSMQASIITTPNDAWIQIVGSRITDCALAGVGLVDHSTLQGLAIPASQHVRFTNCVLTDHGMQLGFKPENCIHWNLPEGAVLVLESVEQEVRRPCVISSQQQAMAQLGGWAQEGKILRAESILPAAALLPTPDALAAAPSLEVAA